MAVYWTLIPTIEKNSLKQYIVSQAGERGIQNKELNLIKKSNSVNE